LLRHDAVEIVDIGGVVPVVMDFPIVWASMYGSFLLVG